MLLSQCNAIHRSIVEQFKSAVVYGKSVKHQPQRVGLGHELADEDVGEYREICPPITPPKFAGAAWHRRGMHGVAGHELSCVWARIDMS